MVTGMKTTTQDEPVIEVRLLLSWMSVKLSTHMEPMTS